MNFLGNENGQLSPKDYDLFMDHAQWGRWHTELYEVNPPWYNRCIGFTWPSKCIASWAETDDDIVIMTHHPIPAAADQAEGIWGQIQELALVYLNFDRREQGFPAKKWRIRFVPHAQYCATLRAEDARASEARTAELEACWGRQRAEAEAEYAAELAKSPERQASHARWLATQPPKEQAKWVEFGALLASEVENQRL